MKRTNPEKISYKFTFIDAKKDELKNKFIKKLQKIIVNNKYIDTKKIFSSFIII